MKLEYSIKRTINLYGNTVDSIEHRAIDADQIKFYTNSDMSKLYKLQCIKYGVFFTHKETLQLGEDVQFIRIDSNILVNNLHIQKNK